MINFQFGTFESDMPGWFDWFSLLISLFVSFISIYGGYKISNNIYNREKEDREKEDKKLDLAGFNLFKNSIEQLNSAVKNQEEDILKYIEKQDFSLTFHQNVNVDFLQFIDAKKIYLILGLEHEEKINSLFKRLYLLNDFRVSLRNEVRTYIKRYNELEKEFYSYRELLYLEYYRLCNTRSLSVKIENNKKMWNFDVKDIFMNEYSKLINQILSNTEIIENNALKSRDKLVSEFVIKISEISGKFIPEDIDAIYINNLANKVNAAYIDMNEITKSHLKAMKSYSDNLNITSEKIELFLK
ncbi:hypothetical protein [Flavobacterium columnare]|uniref:hypothetical protein n=1 Tax=Flavobacterium columnare TaxID=996 RepID=UPI0018965C45|nr:hypothetical protein [Flavobacterium columnare]